jgi:hypothetical protein
MVGIPNRLKDEGGFALAMAIFALVLLAAVVAGGYFSASQEFHIGRGMRSLTTSTYAGEGGILEVIDDWDGDAAFALAPGDTLKIGPVTFEGGGSYVTNIIRVGSAADSIKRYFYIEAIGRPPLPSMGERRQAMVVRAGNPELCCDGGLRVSNTLSFAGGGLPRIYGDDTKVTAWGAICDAYSFSDTTGVVINDSTLINNTSLIDGAPPITEDYPALPQNQIAFPGYTWDDLVALADHHYSSSDHSVNGSSMSLDANGDCDRSDPYNFGAPHSPGHPCFDYFPIIHVGGGGNGRLTLGNGVAQGIFLIENDFTLVGPIDFYGIALVRDDMTMQGPSTFHGYAWAADDAVLTGSTPRLYLSRCAAERAIRLSNLARPKPVDQRSWAELF